MRAALLLLPLALALDDKVSVVQKQLNLEENYTLTMDPTIEYMLQFVPSGDQGEWPSRLWVQSDGGDTSRPLLITARHSTGAVTWQLPYKSGERLAHSLQRTLCFDEPDGATPSECVDRPAARGEFQLHLATACTAPFLINLRAVPARDWQLAFDTPAVVTASQTAPGVHYYAFEPGQESVRLVVHSEDDVCATISIQNYTCPIAETIEDVEGSSVRMTVQRSGGAQLSRSRYPRGFYVVTLVRDTDQPCTGEEHVPDDWLWDAALWPVTAQRPMHVSAREKTLAITVKASLSRTQYVIGVSVTVALFLSFYVAFGALVLAQRWPPWARLTRPRAVLVDNNKSENGAVSEGASTIATTSPRRRRRGSDATFDSSDISDTDSEEEAATPTSGNVTSASQASAPSPALAPTIATIDETIVAAPAPNEDAARTNGAAPVDTETDTTQTQPGVRPFGLPARLRVAALARRRARVLRARSDRYLYTLYTVAVFYALPVVQFVVAFQVILNISGSLDMCYYNFLCAHPAGGLSDFNHVFSNLGYLLLGALFMLQLRRRQWNRKRAPRDEEYGIPAHYGLLSSLGAGMMVVALLSATYHICPNRLNFQFDTAFMYVLAVLSMVKIYQSRHPDINARAHATFGVLAVLIALVVWGVLGGGPLFWGMFTVLHVFTFLLLSLRIYYVGQFRLEKESLAVAARELRSLPARGVRPLYTARLVMLLIANAVNWGFALYGLFTQTADIASHLLSVLLCNTLLYIVFYLVMKLLHGERPRWYSWLFLAGATAAWVPALYFFTSGSTDWSATPAQSRHRNHECRVLQFYDSHDLWHMLSAVALYFTFNAMLTWDDGLAAVKRTDIAVF
ncbi:SID1 transmembrane family member 2 isoform X1 [Manduca sexta]|uniref:SID1 transmembrane family member 2 isoform X1 n=1 Tax=Manduca sexta TaxID=7130 RepID=UPI00188ED58A|nr:SID1 transmembrane family member 2 isoform X1 [Manduca sexta]